jgi:hypothetical protein
VNEFLNSVVFDAEKHTELGNIEVREQSKHDSRLREQWGAIVVAVRNQEGEFILKSFSRYCFTHYVGGNFRNYPN